ncbi:MAG: heparinase II/III family protein, partial [Armatimonadetes bacterium]|nr:heparinase II/III family protein [Armatimonadota bacterium]
MATTTLKNGLVALLGLALAGKADAQGAAPPDPPDIEVVLRGIRPTHPRIFLNQEILRKIKEDGLSPEQQRWLSALKEKVDACPAPPPMDDKLVAHFLEGEGGYRRRPQDPRSVYEGDWGYRTAEAALAYVLTGERRYFDRAMSLLRYSVGRYALFADNGAFPTGKAFERLSALSAYDWLYNDLPQPERQAIGAPLFRSLRAFYQRHRDRGGMGIGINYHDEILGWYLGLVFLGKGIEGADDAACAALLREEHAQYVAVFRLRSSGRDGVHLFGALGYVTQLLATEINFLDAWRTAIGGNFLRHFPNRAYLSGYFLWNTIFAGQIPLEYAWSDPYHINNRLDPHHRPYLTRVPDLHADLGDQVDLEGLAEIAQFQWRPGYQQFLAADNWLTVASPLYFPEKALGDAQIQSVMRRLPRARHFPDPVGHTFMNSGWGENDTYAMFIAGRQSFYRKHYDENHFTIYKKGFLALDSGARGFSIGRKGIGNPDDPRNIGADHEMNYYYDTVAHNGILIRMEGEKLPGFWGQPSEVNTGGMNKNHGAQVLAFETNDRFTYIASDATRCYHEEKAGEVIRQFLFVCPDYFVVFDRVASRTPQQQKTWVFHTQHEPQVRGDLFSAEHREGKVFARTLLPQAAAAEKVGGPGKEFWADGKNWPVRQDWQRLTPDEHLFGCWRMEIASARENERELFLHLIQVGDRGELNEMVPSRRVEEGR